VGLGLFALEEVEGLCLPNDELLNVLHFSDGITDERADFLLRNFSNRLFVLFWSLHGTSLPPSLSPSPPPSMRSFGTHLLCLPMLVF
jgi:hypothetical protein